MCDESYKVIDVETTSGIMFWYDSPTSPNTIFLGTHFVVPNIHADTIFYAEANYNNCLSVREPVLIKVYNAPTAIDETIDLCQGRSTNLSAGNPGMSYLWSTGETTQNILSNGLSNYSVTITTPAPESCSKTKTFTITYHTQPHISDIKVDDSLVTINMVQNGDFLYSIDGNTYQDTNTFTINEGGLYTCYVKERNGCGLDHKNFVVISIPEFFTPNGDNINDTWLIKGIFNFSDAQVNVFDRFGKIITVLNAANPSWDGTYNGHVLPASDYWFVAKINDLLPEKRGHFALKR
jgi:gliding motility-associated-like protein